VDELAQVQRGTRLRYWPSKVPPSVLQGVAWASEGCPVLLPTPGCRGAAATDLLLLLPLQGAIYMSALSLMNLTVGTWQRYPFFSYLLEPAFVKSNDDDVQVSMLVFVVVRVGAGPRPSICYARAAAEFCPLCCSISASQGAKFCALCATIPSHWLTVLLPRSCMPAVSF
jgi:hypothetical protein